MLAQSFATLFDNAKFSDRILGIYVGEHFGNSPTPSTSSGSECALISASTSESVSQSASQEEAKSVDASTLPKSLASEPRSPSSTKEGALTTTSDGVLGKRKRDLESTEPSLDQSVPLKKLHVDQSIPLNRVPLKTLHVNSGFLVAQSEFFMRMLNGGPNEANEQEIKQEIKMQVQMCECEVVMSMQGV